MNRPTPTPAKPTGTAVVVVAGIVLGMCALCVALRPSSSPPPVHVAFLHATNDPSNGRVGVIKLVNNLKEPVFVMGGWYVPAKQKDLSISKNTPLAWIDGEAYQFAARSTNIVQVHTPTNGGPYRLVCRCVPESKEPSRNQRTLRYRTLFFVSPWLHPSQMTVVRWCGEFFAASQSIDFTQ